MLIAIITSADKLASAYKIFAEKKQNARIKTQNTKIPSKAETSTSIATIARRIDWVASLFAAWFLGIGLFVVLPFDSEDVFDRMVILNFKISAIVAFVACAAFRLLPRR